MTTRPLPPLPLLLLSLLSLLLLLPSAAAVQYCFQYTFTGGSSGATQWTVTASGLLTLSTTLSSTQRTQATITSVSGSRTFTNATFRSTANFVSVNASSPASNVAYSQFPYTDTSGWSFALDGPAWYEAGPGAASVRLLTSSDPLIEYSGAQTIYVGQLLLSAQSSVTSLAQCPTNATLPSPSLQPYSFCWYIASDGSDPVSAAGHPWTTYAYGTFTASQPFQQEGRQALQLTSIAGLRVLTIDGASAAINRITGLRHDDQDLSQWGIKNDNVVYTSVPYLDQYGWLLTTDAANLSYPGGVSASSDINFEYDQYASLQYMDLNADAVHLMQSSNQGFAFTPYNGAPTPHAACLNNATVVSVPQTTQWTFCYAFNSWDATNGYWSITASGVLTTYAQSVPVISALDYQPAYRPGYLVLGISGTRTWANASVTSTRNILGVVNDAQVFEDNYPFDNVVYATYPYVDGGGLSYYLDGPVYPIALDSYGQALSNVSFVNIHANGVNPLKELPTGGEAGALLIQPYTSSTPASQQLNQQCSSLVAGTTTQFAFCYWLSGDRSSNDPAPQAAWTVGAWGVVTAVGPIQRENQTSYLVTGISGQRAVQVVLGNGSTVSVTQTITGVRAPNADINTYSYATDNVLYPNNSPHIDLYGWILVLDSPAVYPSNAGLVPSAGTDIDFSTDQFATNQYQDVSIQSSTPATFLQSANAGMNVQPYAGGSVSFTCPLAPASYGSSSSSSGLSGGQIAGIVIGVVVGVALLLAVVVFLVFSAAKRGGDSGSKQLTTSSSETSSNGQVELQGHDAETA